MYLPQTNVCEVHADTSNNLDSIDDYYKLSRPGYARRLQYYRGRDGKNCRNALIADKTLQHFNNRRYGIGILPLCPVYKATSIGPNSISQLTNGKKMAYLHLLLILEVACIAFECRLEG